MSGTVTATPPISAIEAIDGRIFGTNSLSHTLVAVALKGQPEAAELANKYSFLRLSDHAQNKCDFANNFLEHHHADSPLDVQERKAVESLLQFRTNLCRYAHMVKRREMPEPEVSRVVAEIQNDIDHLADPTHPNVTQLEEGTICFAVPGGWGDHGIFFKFKRKGKDYFFEIHNRADRVDDTRLHGYVRIESADKTKVYTKTVCVIKTTAEALKNDEFLRTLVTACSSPDAQLLYDHIYEFFILSNRGVLVKSSAEQLLEELYKELNNILNLDVLKEKIRAVALRVIKTDPNFNTLQLFPTCVETNKVSLEKFVPEPIRWKLKLFTIEFLLKQIIEKESDNEDLPKLRLEVGKVIEHLKGKIKKTAEKTECVNRTRDHDLPAAPPTITHDESKELEIPRRDTDLAALAHEANPLIHSSKKSDLKTLPPDVMREHASKVVKFMKSLSDQELFGTLLEGVNLHSLEKRHNLCEQTLRVMRRGRQETMPEFEQISKMTEAFALFIELKKNEKFDKGRQVKQEFANLFSKVDALLAENNLAKNLTLMPILAERLAALLHSIRPESENFPLMSQIFWVQCRNQCQLLIDRIPEDNILKAILLAIRDFVLRLIDPRLHRIKDL